MSHRLIDTSTISGLLVRCDAMQDIGLDCRYARMFVKNPPVDLFLPNSFLIHMNGYGYGNWSGDGYGDSKMAGTYIYLYKYVYKYDCFSPAYKEMYLELVSHNKEKIMLNVGEHWLFVLSGGFVLSGKVVDGSDDSLTWMLDDTVVVERWGTTEGIGQLRDGPLANTQLRDLGNGIAVERCQCIFRFRLNKPMR